MKNGLASLILGVCMLVGTLASAQDMTVSKDIFSKDQQAVIGEIVRDYILSNPQIVIDAINRYEELEQLRVAAEAQLALIENWDSLANSPDSASVGNPDADVTIIEFFDYNCSWCRRAMPILMTLLKEDPNLRIVFKEYPIRGKDSEAVARASIAATRQGNFMAFHQVSMLAEGQMNLKRFEEIAAEAGVDMEQLNADKKDIRIGEIISENYAIAEKLYMEGTPSFVIGQRILRGWPGEQGMRDVIAEVREANLN